MTDIISFEFSALKEKIFGIREKGFSVDEQIAVAEQQKTSSRGSINSKNIER